jgi:minor extracellular serine protease Vpr
LDNVFTYTVLPAANVDPANINGCDAWPAGAFAGKAALIQRGVCEFGVKVLNAELAGAAFVVVYNSAAGGDALINMGPGAVGDQVTISVDLHRAH